MKIVTLIICLSFLMGCSYSPNAVQIEIDSSFSADKKEIILQSLGDWISKTNNGFGVVSISYPDGISTDTEDNCIKFVNQDVEEGPVPAPGLVRLGYTDTEYVTFAHPTTHVQATIYIWGQEPDDEFNGACRHEIGHALLINHYCSETEAAESWTNCEVVSTDPEPSVMHPTVTVSIVEPIDAYRFCQQWGCPE